ncbi:MAG: CoA pyrophosphatase [Deltaproteobacteria bacterium]|nr:CoA pyrophosphatase [Deltaproteobacteria bacterium]MBW2659692.1 CoA pyrophosphatase [Deltaproteobacteria bacterium]
MEAQEATAAVAIIKTSSPQESFLILRRASHPLDPWSGHFSFPGGRREQGDKNLLQTSIRETMEEVGIALTPAMMQARLPITPAGRNMKAPILVQPFIFCLYNQPSVIPDSREVQSIHWLDAKEFQNLENHRQVELLPDRVFPAFPLGNYYLWGFTYTLLKSILNM